MPAKMDWKGKRFGLLIVTRELPNRRAEALCECGNKTIVARKNLSNGHTKSCGCKRRMNLYKHGESQTPEYRVWRGILDRCLNEKSNSYPRYGGRGIGVHQSWIDSFDSFLSDMGRRPAKNLSIDRIDNSKGYCADNCRWATSKQQANNRRNPVERSGLKIKGVDVLRIKVLRDINGMRFTEIAKQYGCTESTVRHAYRNR